ncbi:MAG: hypothetical protein ACJ8AO_11160, partial [Gemmatimonadaceae bacterium]
GAHRAIGHFVRQRRETARHQSGAEPHEGSEIGGTPCRRGVPSPPPGRPMTSRELPRAWRERAAQLRRYAPEVANALDDAAGELEAAIGEDDARELTLAEAAAESGYSAEHLRKLVATGQLANAGRHHAPRIRRGDLPRKATPRPGAGAYSVDRDAIDLVRRQGRPRAG